MLKIYNSLTRRNEVFQPIDPGKVRMYVCGITVYDYCHLGHARSMLAFDVIARWLRQSGFDLTYVRNITDIDDKIIQRAAENGETIADLTNRFIAAMDEDARRLGVLKPDHEPRATDFVPGMIDMIQRLIDRELAYVAENGDVCYSVRSFEGYGRLSGKLLEDLRAGERVDVKEGKNDPLDFVLWKKAKPGEPQWESPWGSGRPGWHIECSVMGWQLLGEKFDIHGGGQDLQFPHHENEIAQSEGCFCHRHVNYWLHNGFVRMDDEKMSKSLGNFFTIRDVLERFDAEVVRFFMLRAHYRSPINYADQHLDEAKSALARLYTALKNAPPDDAAIDWSNPHAVLFKSAMDDDFNTPEAVAVLFDLASEVNRTHSAQDAGILKALAGVLGLLERDPNEFLRSDSSGQGYSPEMIEELIAVRAVAKKERNFAGADRIRTDLLANGIALEDRATGIEWRRI